MRITEPYIIFPRKLSSGRTVYYYQYRDEKGHRSPAYSCGTSSKAQARRLCQKLYNSGEFSKPSDITFKAFSYGFFDDDSEFCKWKAVNKQSLAKSTLDSYRRLLATILVPYFGTMQLSKITRDTIKQWIVDCEEKYSAKTTNNAQSVLSIILKSANDKRLISEVPTVRISFRKVAKKERKLLTVDELNQIYHSDEWYWSITREVFLVCSITGMRIGEVTGLQPSDIMKDRINVQHSYHPVFGLGPTKTRVCRYVPVPPALNLKNISGKKWVFQKPDSDLPIDEKYFYKRFMIVCSRLGIDTKGRGITVHSLRNTFISYMRGSATGQNIDLKIKAVVGHTDESMTDWYTYWTPEMFPEIYALQERLYKEITEVRQ